jgi:hypothetical protein
MKTFREIALLEAKQQKTSISGTYYIPEVQDMINWCEKQKEWVSTSVQDDYFEVSYSTPKAALNKTKSIRKYFDDIISEHGNNGNILEIYLNTKEVLLRKKLLDKVDKNADYVVYHNTYSAATREIENFAKKRGYNLDDETDSDNIGSQMFDLVGTGPAKPKGGKSNKFQFELYKGSTKQKVYLNVTIYNRETSSNEYELNMYIN